MILYWFRIAEKEISLINNEEIISFILQLKSLV